MTKGKWGILIDIHNGFQSWHPILSSLNGRGGGVFLLVSQLYESHQPEELFVEASSDCEAVWVKVKIQGSSDLYVGSFYRPPDKNNPEYLQELQSIMSRIPTDKGAHLWLGGDFNLPDITWREESVVPYATYSAVSNQLLTIVKDMHICTLTKGLRTPQE